MSIEGPVIDAGPQAFLPMKKNKLEAAGEVEGRINLCWRASLMYSSIALRSGMDKG